jgi:tRNA threonylcarbamoyladenosine biosynthesis protein TsaE
LSYSYKIFTVDDLLLPAKKIKSLIGENSIFTFEGDMGAGKTTLISSVCKLLETEPASSPTYAIINTYNSLTIGAIYHFDCYRLKNADEAIESGLDEIIDSGAPCFIEWADKIQNLLPIKCVKVKIEPNNTYRTITIIL